MMSGQNKVTGIVLAGGLARRMNKQDKGLIEYHNKSMVTYAVKAMMEVTDNVVINANRNLDAYAQFGCEVITDQTNTFDGPLAGILSAMMYAETSIVCVIPCDSPLIKAKHLQRLLIALDDTVDIAVASDGNRMQPVFLALKTSLQSDLEAYLQAGERKIDVWLQQHSLRVVDFSQDKNIFMNINTLDELNTLENQQHD
jgi:molybdopterin-guanine dinucleotide biosynthesis protein A